MLKRFEVKNFKNFGEKLVFDLSEVKSYEFNSEAIKNNIVNKSLIYGPNGSGKSNLGFAILDLVSHLTDTQKDIRFYIDFLNAGCAEDHAEFKYTFQLGKDVVDYCYHKTAHDLLVFEELHINGKQVIKYDRKKEKDISVNLNGAETLNKFLNGNKISAVKYVKSNAVLKGNQINKAFYEFYDFVERMLLFRSLDSNVYIGFQSGNSHIQPDIVKRGKLKDFEDFLNRNGIKCKLTKTIVNNQEDIAFDFGKKTINFYLNASNGTKALTLFYYWLMRLREKTKGVSFLFIDEFDAFYHHELARLVVEEVKNTSCQSILTTHNTALMSNDLLRPDCYFILDNNKIDPIYKFTDKELRKAHNIEKMYKAGAFDE
ncbi:MAG TPA: AAA family ATPase [Clostridiales bacterium]|nr:AAA family ATPase [Clostridiales bacterium]HQP69147.1 AAA family ATPase [Clostridiales bacterium]